MITFNKVSKSILQKRVLLPLVLVELYLLATLLIFSCGPVVWRIESPVYFWSLIFSYHAAFLSAFLLYTQNAKWDGSFLGRSDGLEVFIVRYYWVFIALALIGSLINYRHFAQTESYIPYTLFSDFYEGLINPGNRRAYTGSDEANASFHGNFAVSLFYGVIAFARYGIIPVLLSSWRYLSVGQRLAAIAVSLIPAMAGVSIGTNKPIFDFLFFYSTILFFQFLSSSRVRKIKLFKNKKLILLVMCLIGFTLWYFDHSMSQRAADFSYMEGVSYPGDIVFKSSLEHSEVSVFENAFEKVTVYLVQGYYGMSLALGEDFDSTFGVGNSNFFLYQARDVFGVDLFSRTYQYKISDRWDQFVQWHSFYSQMANDVGFLGVILVMFVLGFWFSVMCYSAVVNNNILAKCILPFFILMFVYIPANNQVFNMMDTTFAFLMFNVFWLLNRFSKRRVLRHKSFS